MKSLTGSMANQNRLPDGTSRPGKTVIDFFGMDSANRRRFVLAKTQTICSSIAVETTCCETVGTGDESGPSRCDEKNSQTKRMPQGADLSEDQMGSHREADEGKRQDPSGLSKKLDQFRVGIEGAFCESASTAVSNKGTQCFFSELSLTGRRRLSQTHPGSPPAHPASNAVWGFRPPTQLW